MRRKITNNVFTTRKSLLVLITLLYCVFFLVSTKEADGYWVWVDTSYYVWVDTSYLDYQVAPVWYSWTVSPIVQTTSSAYVGASEPTGLIGHGFGHSLCAFIPELHLGNLPGGGGWIQQQSFPVGVDILASVMLETHLINQTHDVDPIGQQYETFANAGGNAFIFGHYTGDFGHTVGAMTGLDGAEVIGANTDYVPKGQMAYVDLTTWANIEVGWYDGNPDHMVAAYAELSVQAIPNPQEVVGIVDYCRDVWVEGGHNEWVNSGYWEWVPEPATICLLGLGALGLLRKRRA